MSLFKNVMNKTIDIWITKDADGEICIFDRKPDRYVCPVTGTFWLDRKYGERNIINTEMFDEIMKDNDIIEATLTIKENYGRKDQRNQ